MANAVTDKKRAKMDAPSRKTRSIPRNQEPTIANALSDKERSLMNAYWRAANYLSVGQIYLYDNPLLKKPLQSEHIKPRLLGHWGTTPDSTSFTFTLTGSSRSRTSTCRILTGPGHGGPGIVANTWLEGTYSEVYPDISQDEEGIQKLIQAILVSWGNSQPRSSGDPRVNPRRRRARLRLVARLWSGVRQSRSHRGLCRR